MVKDKDACLQLFPHRLQRKLGGRSPAQGSPPVLAPYGKCSLGIYSNSCSKALNCNGVFIQFSKCLFKALAFLAQNTGLHHIFHTSADGSQWLGQASMVVSNPPLL